MSQKTLVFDNGAGGLKAGFAGQLRPLHTIPNCTAKIKNQTQNLVGDETAHANRDSSQISILRPFDRGYITNWEPEFEVWRRMLGKRFLNVEARDTRLLATEAPFGPLVLQEAANEVVFEEFGFAACYRCPSAALSCYHEQVLEEERDNKIKEQIKARRAELLAMKVAADREALAKARADEEAARAAAAAACKHGRGTRISTGVLTSGTHTRQRYDPANPDGTFSSKARRTSNSSAGLGSASRRAESPHSGGYASSGSGTKRRRSRSHSSTRSQTSDGSVGTGSGGGSGAGVAREGFYARAAGQDLESEGEQSEDLEDVPQGDGRTGAGSAVPGEEKDEVLSALLDSWGGGRSRGPMSDVCIVVDSGFSFTHVLPFYQGRALHKSSLRVNVGGKLLTNYLKEVVSYRQWNMMDEFELMEQVKESLCYVSLNLGADLREARRMRPGNKIVREFVLPDRKNVLRGYAREVNWEARAKRMQKEALGEEDDQQLQVLTMGNERFHIPEVLFNPSNVGLRQMGISEAVETCISRCPKPLQPQLYANVLLTGGNCSIPNFKERLQRDMRADAPEYCEVNVTMPEDPAIHAWRGGSLFASSKEFSSFAVSKQEYDEFGHTICNMRFADW